MPNEPARETGLAVMLAEQVQLARARLIVVGTFTALWIGLWLAGIPYPVPFLVALCIEGALVGFYPLIVRRCSTEGHARSLYYAMLAIELALLTIMVYYLGGLTNTGSYAYVFGLIFTTAFFDRTRGLLYTTAAVAAFSALGVLEATGTIPHHVFLREDALRYRDPRFVITGLIGTAGVFFGIFNWVNWVGDQLRQQRDAAVSAQAQLARSQVELEQRVEERTAALGAATAGAKASAELLTSTMESTADGILVVDSENRVLYTNGRFAEMWRIPPALISARDRARMLEFVASQLADPDMFVAKAHELYGSEREDLDTLILKDEREFERYSRPLLTDGRSRGRVWSFRDISERRRSEAQLIELANHDPLTGLLNRRRLDEEIERKLAEAERYGLRGALLFLDLDQFKDVNDSRGHRAGDELLKGVARILTERLRETDVVARLGGDEFSVLLPYLDGDQAMAVAEDLLNAIRGRAFVVGAGALRITASIGVALFDHSIADAGELLARADLAMYRAKEEGRNRVGLFDPGLDWQAQIESRIGWHRRVREALEGELFELYAQPILDLAANHVTQYELLLRMKSGEGVVLPTVFLEVAERSGLIQDIDRWVVRRAIQILADLQVSDPAIRVEVNLSGRAFADRELLPLIQRELSTAGVNPASLVLEVTETAAIANIDEAQVFIRTLKRIGCQFALDDFGVGFSSFSHLKHLPVDYLKIDGSFIRDLPRDTVDQQLVRAIVGIARGLGKRTIAEFVGDEQTLALLREYGVDFAQGYHVGLPAPLGERLARAQAA